mgnify:CR=1 FL=1
MKKQIFGLAWSIFVMASVMFAFFAVFSFLDGLVEVFF